MILNLFAHRQDCIKEDVLTDSKAVCSEVAICLPVIASVVQQVRNTSSDVEQSVVGVCRQFQNMVALVQKNVSLTSDILGNDDVQQDGDDKSLKSLLASIRTTFQQVESLEQASQRGAAKITSVQEAMKAIEKRTTEVESIFAQIRILGINAAILAATAGEHGRAFGVVAEKTRELSGVATELNKSINKTMKQLTTRVDETFAEFEIVTSVSHEVQSEVGQTLDAIDQGHEKLRQAIKRSTLNSQSLTKDISAAVMSLQFQDRVSQQMEHVAETLEEIAGRLRTQIFKRLNSANRSEALSADQWTDQLMSRCTMQLERQVVSAFVTNIDDKSDEFDDSVELF